MYLLMSASSAKNPSDLNFRCTPHNIMGQMSAWNHIVETWKREMLEELDKKRQYAGHSN
jgi:hypothetical protein